MTETVIQLSPSPEPKTSQYEVEIIKNKKADQPLATERRVPSLFSINQALTEKTEEKKEEQTNVPNELLPQNHFSSTDLQQQWEEFLSLIRKKDGVLFNAIQGFRFSKKDENTILVSYPSHSAKAEFEKVESDFFNHFKRKVNHYNIKTEYEINIALKQEIVTKKNIFDKMAQENPLLKELNEHFKLDLS